MKQQVLIDFITRFTGSVLDLKAMNLGDKSDTKLIDILRAILPSVTFLDLAENVLGNKSGAELAEVFKAIPPSVTFLDLSGNDLGNKSGAELTQAFIAIPPSVTSLNLGVNNLGRESSTVLAQALAAIPSSVTFLDLQENGLWRISGAELAQAFKAIPPSVTSLNLKWNDLGNKSGDELAQALAAIAPSVTTLDLSRNSLGNKSGDELTQLFGAIPLTVQTIDGLENFSTQQQTQINQLRWQLRIDDLANQVGYRVMLGPYSSNDYDFTTITPLMPIDETNLAQVIHALEQKNTTNAYIAAAMLLLGDIENTITSDRTTEGEVAYSNQRTHDAIKLLFKAVQCDPRSRDPIAHIAKTLQIRFPEGSLFYCRLALLQPQAEPSSALAHALGLFGGGDNFMTRLPKELSVAGKKIPRRRQEDGEEGDASKKARQHHKRPFPEAEEAELAQEQPSSPTAS